MESGALVKVATEQECNHRGTSQVRKAPPRRSGPRAGRDWHGEGAQIENRWAAIKWPAGQPGGQEVAVCAARPASRQFGRLLDSRAPPRVTAAFAQTPAAWQVNGGPADTPLSAPLSTSGVAPASPAGSRSISLRPAIISLGLGRPRKAARPYLGWLRRWRLRPIPDKLSAQSTGCSVNCRGLSLCICFRLEQ